MNITSIYNRYKFIWIGNYVQKIIKITSVIALGFGRRTETLKSIEIEVFALTFCKDVWVVF